MTTTAVHVDCPPNLGLITLNGLGISSGYIIPTIPDVLSTYGMDQILTCVSAFSESLGETIAPVGIVISKFRSQSPTHCNAVRRLRQSATLPHVFSTVIKDSERIAASPEHRTVRELRQKYGYRGQYQAYRDLTREIVAAVRS